MKKPNGKATGRAISASGRILWLVILVPVMSVSAYSLYFVARHLGVPPPIAACFSACFDGVALLAANYSLRYAQAGLSGSFPRTVVRIAAGLAAYIQTLHVTLGGEPRAAALLWASLPISAVTVYEIHIRWERRVALARAGTTYPSPLPAFGFVTWVLFPLATLTALESVVRRRKDAIVERWANRPVLASVSDAKEDKPVLQAAVLPDQPANVRPIRSATPNVHAPTRHIRQWAKDQGIQVSDRARLPRAIIERYEREVAGGE